MILSPDFFAHQEIGILARDLACVGAILILGIVWRLK
jgi:hypothetical protein